MARCDRCPVPAPGYCVGRGLLPLCDRIVADPARWASAHAAGLAFVAAFGISESHAGGPETMADAPPAAWTSAARDDSGWPACGHRSTRWTCGGDLRATCALGRGAGGIVDEHHCVACPERAPAPETAP